MMAEAIEASDTDRTGAVSPARQTHFLTLVGSAEGERRARIMIESLRAFGGPMSNCPVWIFLPQPDAVSCEYPEIEGVTCFPLEMEAESGHYLFAAKVYASAQAEAMADGVARSLVWLNPGCLIVNPPLLFELDPAHDAAFRPVHIRNIGSPGQEPLDDFWEGVYRTMGIDDVPFRVESFVDSWSLRPYFNSHCFSIDPSMGLMRAWLEHFRAMVSDREFQSGPCHDELHQIFLHQAILSALVAKSLNWNRIRLLPAEYSYPLHFQEEIPEPRRAASLDSLVCAVYEEMTDLNAIQAGEALGSWLQARMARG